MITFTSDIDWAPDEVIEDMLDIFEHYQIPCTLFCTHDSKVLRNCNRELFEIAIHPNFNPLLNGTSTSSAEVVLQEILSIYPEARGVRSHSMTQSSQLLSLFRKAGLEYDTNQFLPYQYQVKPYKCWTGLTRIPYHWEDDLHFAYSKSFDYDLFQKLEDFPASPHYILDFHPIHVYLNTESQKTYDDAKKHYHHPQELLKLRNKQHPGTRDFLIRTLQAVNDRKIQANKMSDLIFA